MSEHPLAKKNIGINPSDYSEFFANLKTHIQLAQIRTISKVNTDLILLYWQIGREILERQKTNGWGAKVIERLSKDLIKEFPDMKGFSTRNLKYMRILAETYNDQEFVQQVVAQIPWGHNVRILDKVKNSKAREFYIRNTIENGWSRSILELQIESELYERQGKAQTNFERTLPKVQSDLANQLLKDPYNFDFLTIGLEAHERELENNLLQNIKEFLLEMGVGFSFVGSQYHLEVGEQDYYIDLLFYHLQLRAFVIIDLKTVEFKPEFSGKMSFYLSAVDDLLKHSQDNPSIGLILCKTKNKITVDYALRDNSKPIGVSTIKLSENLPNEIKGNLPTIEEIETLTVNFDLIEAFKLSAAISSYIALTAEILSNLFDDKKLSYEVKSEMVLKLRAIQQKIDKFTYELSSKKQAAKNNLTTIEIKNFYTYINSEIIKPFSSVLIEMNLFLDKKNNEGK